MRRGAGDSRRGGRANAPPLGRFAPLPLERGGEKSNKPAPPAPEHMAAVAISDLRRHLGYLKPGDIARIEEAYQFSDAAHQGQFRLSGHPYISHPIAVAEIVADWQLDAQAVMEAPLHDGMEDTEISKEQITERFGKPVAELVDGLSKLDRIEFQSQAEAPAEN